MLSDALASAKGGPMGEWWREWQCDGRLCGSIVCVPVFDALLVVFEVLFDVLRSETLDLYPRELRVLSVVIREARDKVRNNSHLLLIDVLPIHLRHPARDRLNQLTADKHGTIA